MINDKFIHDIKVEIPLFGLSSWTINLPYLLKMWPIDEKLHKNEGK